MIDDERLSSERKEEILQLCREHCSSLGIYGNCNGCLISDYCSNYGCKEDGFDPGWQIDFRISGLSDILRLEE